MKIHPSHLSEQIQQQLKSHGRINLLEQRYAQLFPVSSLVQDRLENPVRLAELGLRHEDKAIAYQGLPYLMKQKTFTQIGQKFEQLAVIVERVIDLYLREQKIRDFFRLQARYDNLIRLGAAYRPFVQYCRYDFTLDDLGRPRIFELNTHSPAGSSFYRRFSQVFNQSQICTELLRAGFTINTAPLEAPEVFAAAIIKAAQQHGQYRKNHYAAILNSRYLTMNNELDLIAAQFVAAGKPALRCYVEDLSYRDGSLYYQDKAIDICFNKFDDSHGPDAYECAFSRSHAEVQAYLDAVAAGAVFAVNSFASMYLPENKSILALLWSPLLLPYLSTAEIALIQEIIPYTRVLRDLNENEFKHILSNKSELVCKRSLDTRGRSVVIGRDVSHAEWQQVLQQARQVQTQEDFVIQELSPVETFSAQLRADTPACNYFSSLAYFMIQGQAQGIIVRSSVEATTNVARNGFVQPFVLIA